MNEAKEIEVLQSIINQWVEFSFRVRGWLLALLTALSIGYLSGSIEFRRSAYIAISLILIICFWFIDQSQRVVAGLAINRMKNIEELLRSGDRYDGPRIAESLLPASSTPFVLRRVLASTFKGLNFVPYLMLLLLSIGLAFSKPLA